MPDNLSSTLTVIAINYGVPLLLVFEYACRVRHPSARALGRVLDDAGHSRRGAPSGGRGGSTTG